MIIRFTNIALILLLLFGCNAPRSNPLDPENPDNKLYSVNGRVISKRSYVDPLPGVQVVWENTSKFVTTDSSGFFILNEINADDGFMTFKKEGFGNDTLYLEWRGEKSIELSEVILDAAPVLDSVELFSIHQNKRGSNVPNQSLTIRARISDLDGTGDIGNVYTECKSLSFSEELIFNTDTEFYEKTFKSSQFSVSSLVELMGKEFTINVKPRNEKTGFKVGESTLIRVISDTMGTRGPEAIIYGYDPPLLLEWEKGNFGFEHSYSVELFTNEPQPELLWDSTDISKDIFNVQIYLNIPEGDYFWMVWCEDEFNNKGSSYKRSFTIREDTTKTY